MDSEQPESSKIHRKRTSHSTRLGYGEMSLTELVGAIQDGDDWAWQALVERLSGTVKGALSTFRVDVHLRNDAAAETWKTLFEHLDRIRDVERLPSWAAIVAINNMRRILRRRTQSVLFGDMELLANIIGVDDEDLVVEGEVREALVRAVGRLSGREQAIVRGRSYTDEPEPLAAMEERLGIPTGSIGPTLGRCMHKLRSDPEVVRLFPTVGADDGPSSATAGAA